jgi:hypothetical protein
VDDAATRFGVDEKVRGISLIEPSLWQTAINWQRFLESIEFKAVFIGGIVFQRSGEPRVTGYVNAMILVEFGTDSTAATKVLKRYQSRIDDAISFAIQARIVLLQDLRGNKIDLSLAGMPYEERLWTRSSSWQVPGLGHIRTCIAEDLIILQAFASRPQDWIDVNNIIIRQGNRLNRELIHSELSILAQLK